MQSEQQLELTAVKAELVKAQAHLHGATLLHANSDRLQELHPADTSQELLSARACLQDLHNEIETDRAQMVCINSTTDLSGVPVYGAGNCYRIEIAGSNGG